MHTLTRRDFLRVSALGLSGAVLMACGLGQGRATTPTLVPTISASASPVPSSFQSLYTELDTAMSKFDATLNVQSNPAPITFAAELLPANGNRGTELLNPQTLTGARVFLDALQRIGVRGVTVAIKYPILTPDFPNAAQYTDFFKNVAAEVRKRGMKMDVEVGMVFPPPFSSLDVNYKGLTLEQYRTKNKQMVQTIIREVQPDYLNLGSEPDTEASITGIRELNTPQVYTDLINFTLQGLDRGKTLIGAGLGTWNSLEFVKAQVANTTLDFIALHIYPVTGKALDTAVAAADLAHQSNKRVILDEAWLYKTSANEPPTSIAANSEIFRRDAYSFWTPLDQKFIALMTKLARAKNIEYVSLFWAAHLFGLLDYAPDLQTLPYNELTAKLNAVAVSNMTSGKLSPIGEYYKQVVEGK